MAGTSLLALIDDVASILDDVAILGKAAAKKTTGVLGDDLALNAQQVAGVQAERELPVVWAVAKGSARNKLILVPLALVISAFVPWLVVPLLMVGGAFLCFEGAEKIAHRLFAPKAVKRAEHADRAQANADQGVDLVAFEREKIKGAIRTDFILSAEIVAISLGIVADAPFTTRVVVMVVMATLMTVGVYGVVALIVKLDDIGLHFTRRLGESLWARLQRGAGVGILASASWLMKLLSIAGTIAMFLVGGGILTHGLPALRPLGETTDHLLAPFHLTAAAPLLANGMTGLIAGSLLVAVVAAIRKLARRWQKTA